MAEEDAAQSGRDVAKGAGLIVAANILNRALNVITVPVLTRTLGSHGYGLFVLARQMLWTASPLASLGTHTGLVRFVARGYALGEVGEVKGAVRNAALVWFATAIALACLGFFGAEHLAVHWFHKPELAALLRLMAPILPAMALSGVLISLGVGRKDMLPFAMAEVAEPVVILAAFLALRSLIPAVTAAGASWASAQSVTLMVMAIWTLRRMPALLDRAVPTKGQLTALMSYSFPLLLTAVLSFGLYQMNVLLAGVRMPATEVGQYGVATAFGMAYNLWLEAFRRAFMPNIAELHTQGRIEEFRRLYQKVTRWGILVTLPMGAFLVAQARHVMEICGKEFGTGATALIVIVIGQTVNAATGPSGGILVMSGRQWTQALNNVVVTAVNVLLVWFLAPRYGALGAAIALAAGLTTWNILIAIEVYRAFQANPLSRDLIRPLAALLPCLPLPFLVHPGSMAQLIVAAGLYYALSMAVLWWIGIGTEDQNLVRSTLRALRARFSARPPG